MSQRAVLPAPVRQPAPKQTAADRQRVYDYVSARDKTCRAPVIDLGASRLMCSGKEERHHAGMKFGLNRNRLTDARHVVLLCQWHHNTWAPSRSRLILEWLDRVETEAGR